MSWGKALDVAGVLADSGLRRPESIYYNQRFTSSQILIPLSLNKPPKCLSYQKWTKSLLLLWKFQQTPTKILAKEKRLKLSRARIRARTKRFLPTPPRRPQTLLSLNPSKLLTQGLPRQKLRLRILSFVVYLFFCYVYCFCITFLLRKCITFLLSMKMSFFCFIRHDK